MRNLWSRKHWRTGCVVVVSIAGAVLVASSTAASADYQRTLPLTFGVGNGETITVVSHGSSNCTKDEIGLSFTSGDNIENRSVTMTARTSGVCAFEASWNEWKITVTGPYVNGVGYFRYGQKRVRAAYDGTCIGHWTGLRCIEQGNNDKILVVPAACTIDAGSQCRVVAYDPRSAISRVDVNKHYPTDNHHHAKLTNIGGGLCYWHTDNGRHVLLIRPDAPFVDYNGTPAAAQVSNGFGHPCVLDIAGLKS